MQKALMKFNPSTRAVLNPGVTALEYRIVHGRTFWQYNPWTGAARTDSQISADPYGLFIPSTNQVDSKESFKNANFEILMPLLEVSRKCDDSCRAGKHVAYVVGANINDIVVCVEIFSNEGGIRKYFKLNDAPDLLKFNAFCAKYGKVYFNADDI